ncbi:transglutaminase family protein [uncultured Sulfitobacter sp.]|uniref:transglutaminase-like domain-containing protein n=1 Tax=uncultured Sulfitobacter sp. TaxID=191468 RepID=UPI0026224415|nr:transglutaminase family protein [uncultured Sulfitobacter sp.]
MSHPDAELSPTRLLDFQTAAIAELVEARAWRDLSEHDRIGAAYDFVRNKIAFGYNAADDLPASAVLRDGYGQCNTKATLLMALLRALDVPCRLHGFTIHKSLQRGIVPEIVYPLAPNRILHSWVEVWHEGRWINLEGFILDDAVLTALQARFANEIKSLCGYGVGTDSLSAPSVEWSGTDTYIQRTGINADLGLFETPDDFYAQHQQSFGRLRGLLYRYLIRHWMNARVKWMRTGKVPFIPDLGQCSVLPRNIPVGNMRSGQTVAKQ